ncbi:MAG: HAMP domain-containing histidine kinase [Polyangiaceae bacterium]|nr:HAMP domain-containing histidine kinase [Polyangiaceae bacterium]
MRSAERLVGGVLLTQLGVGLVVLVGFSLLAPPLLLLDAREAQAVRSSTLQVAVAVELAAQLAVYLRLTRLRYLLRAIALGSRAFEPQEIEELASLPAWVARVSVAVGSLACAATLVPQLGAEDVDLGTRLALAVLGCLAVGAGGIPLYVILRRMVALVLELVPADSAREVLDELDLRGVPARRTATTLLLSVVAPVVIVAVGASVVAHAQVRRAVETSRIDAAIQLARGPLDALPAASPTAGQHEATRIAAEQGYLAHARPQPALYRVQRGADDRLGVTVPNAEGHALVRFATPDAELASVPVVLAAVVAVLLAAAVGRWLGRALARDLEVAAAHLSELGSERLRRGTTRLDAPARFSAVARLADAVDALTDRFREFAAAQERKLDTHEASLRLRGLLFASVSHDLKSPLNSILGFAALVDAEPLNDGQRESVAVIERRARELLALIETILDAARVEAQQLQLTRVPGRIDEIVALAITRGDELGPMEAAPVKVQVEGGLPEVTWDEARISQALAVLLGHAKRLCPAGGVELRVARRDERRLVITVREPSGTYKLEDVALLLDPVRWPTVKGRLGGLAVGLPMARAIVALHGGKLTIEPARGGAMAFRAVIPIEPP